MVDTSTGREMGTHVFDYPRWKAGLYCDPARNQFRQHPLDYLEGLAVSIVGALEQCEPGVAERPSLEQARLHTGRPWRTTHLSSELAQQCFKLRTASGHGVPNPGSMQMPPMDQVACMGFNLASDSRTVTDPN